MSDIPDFYRGDTKKYKVVVTDADSGDPISVDGGTLTVTLKKKEKDADADAALQVTQACTEADPLVPTGIIQIVLPKEKTELITPGTFYYDFQFENSAGEVTTLLAGTVAVLYDVTETAG